VRSREGGRYGGGSGDEWHGQHAPRCLAQGVWASLQAMMGYVKWKGGRC
jgi:hypothetical protein